MASKYIVEHIDANGNYYHTISGQFTLNINEAHKNGCGLKNIQRDFAGGIADGSVRIIEVKANDEAATEEQITTITQAQAEHEGRVYQLRAEEQNLPALRADMIARGWDGVVYHGISIPVGRQRKTMIALFYRSANTGNFFKVI